MRQRVPLLLVLLALALRPAPASACSCVYGGPFSQVAPQADLVVAAEVIAHHANSMQVEVVQVLKGEETRKRLTVWGDNGIQCRPYVDGFPEKTRWVLAIFRYEEEEARKTEGKLLERLPEDAKPPFYVMSVCGAYSLEIKGEDAQGHIAREGGSEIRESIPLHELARWFEEGAKGKLSPLSLPE